ncbi:hypothetical protein Mgra_00005887 [Meloidogyne graminicola]|uniref:Uncharacterized protein n=1 Tax=Meloidogyne graminicola TaxID=189291 RepID=A0A8S9ZMT5_9BILA|nr:hypothetical protein Mgra_00005887 [Meloidogyne graminicola]
MKNNKKILKTNLISQQKHDENDKIIERKGRVGSSHQTESKQHEQQKHFHQSDKEEHLNASNQKKEQFDIKKEEKNNDEY